MRIGIALGGMAGVGLVLAYTGLMSSADAVTKLLAGSYAAPQLYALSGAIVVALCVLVARFGPKRQSLRTTAPRAMALRSGLTVIACTAFFYAFKLLPFAEVFLFIGLMPLIAGFLSGPILGEHVRPAVWGALAAGGVGVLCLFPSGLSDIGLGHVVALLACVSGTVSMVLARFIGRYESNALAQVFYPNLAIMATMAVALPFVWLPMSLSHLGWAVVYALLLFSARWLLVVALRLLAAYVVTPLMNLQFVWMVILGAVFFGEHPGLHVYLGVFVVISSGIYLVIDQLFPTSLKARFPQFRSVRVMN